jgi:hypothetical protein
LFQTGRIGADAPAEHVIGSLVTLLGSYALPLVPALAARFPRRAALRGALVCALVTSVAMAVFAARSPFDKTHQRRVFVLHVTNVRVLRFHECKYTR